MSKIELGFSVPQVASPAVYFVKGPDNENHSLGCDFYIHDGVVPCSCDATRHHRSTWWNYWLVWAKHRSSGIHHKKPVKWPVHGPDGTPWIPGVDFDDSPDDKESYDS